MVVCLNRWYTSELSKVNGTLQRLQDTRLLPKICHETACQARKEANLTSSSTLRPQFSSDLEKSPALLSGAVMDSSIVPDCYSVQNMSLFIRCLAYWAPYEGNVEAALLHDQLP